MLLVWCIRCAGIKSLMRNPIYLKRFVISVSRLILVLCCVTSSWTILLLLQLCVSVWDETSSGFSWIIKRKSLEARDNFTRTIFLFLINGWIGVTGVSDGTRMENWNNRGLDASVDFLELKWMGRESFIREEMILWIRPKLVRVSRDSQLLLWFISPRGGLEQRQDATWIRGEMIWFLNDSWTLQTLVHTDMKSQNWFL